MFNIGDRVIWRVRTLPNTIHIGTVTNVIPNDKGSDDFTLYDVDFAFGPRTLHGNELSPVVLAVSACNEKDVLLNQYRQTTDVYQYAVSGLADAVGMMAHSEFEFLAAKVESARRLSKEALERLKRHTAQHGC